jgi:hypothetical protein
MGVPANEAIRRPFLESLSDGEEHRLAETVQAVATRLGLSEDDLSVPTPSGKHSLFYDRLCWTRWYLSKGELVVIPRRGFTKITPRGLTVLREAPDPITTEYLMQFPEYVKYTEYVKNSSADEGDAPTEEEGSLPLPPPIDPRVWIEKKLVTGSDQYSAGYFGKVLFSPQRSKDGADIYRFMRDVAIGDIILHLTDNRAITGISQAASTAQELTGAEGPEWETEPSYRIELAGFTKVDPPLDRDVFFASPFRERLVDLIKSGHKNLFYSSAPALNQGAYLTPAPPALVRILNDAYRSIAGRPLISLNDSAATEPLEQAIGDATLFDALVRETFWTESALSNIIGAMRHPVRPARQIILAGPPGTSKTFLAQKLVNYLTKGDASRAHLVQFHPSYSYEQFVEGLRPDVVNGAVQFRPVAGVVVDLAEKCRSSNEDHFLIIDEFNRANLSRVLGELMYLFEYRDRQIDLPYRKGFSLPPNLFFIATMNTADRSIRSIDIALRRRFDVFECQADPDILSRYYAFASDNENDVPDLIDGFVRLNERLQSELDEHHTIGHAFFMSPHFTVDDLQAIWTRKILPLIEEYFFASPEITESFQITEFWPSIA